MTKSLSISRVDQKSFWPENRNHERPWSKGKNPQYSGKWIRRGRMPLEFRLYPWRVRKGLRKRSGPFDHPSPQFLFSISLLPNKTLLQIPMPSFDHLDFLQSICVHPCNLWLNNFCAFSWLFKYWFNRCHLLSGELAQLCYYCSRFCKKSANFSPSKVVSRW